MLFMVDEFWQRIDMLLSENRKSLKQLWAAIRVKAGTGDGWRYNKRFPSVDYCVDIARYLGVSVEWLVTGEEISLPDEQDVSTIGTSGIVNDSKIRQFIPGERSGNDAVTVPVVIRIVPDGGTMSECSDANAVIPMEMLSGGDPAKVRVVQVIDDAMQGEQIITGDFVIYLKDLVEDDGIYVVQFGESRPVIRRLVFGDDALRIVSANTHFPEKVLRVNDSRIMILGKVSGVMHRIMIA